MQEEAGASGGLGLSATTVTIDLGSQLSLDQGSASQATTTTELGNEVASSTDKADESKSQDKGDLKVSKKKKFK